MLILSQVLVKAVELAVIQCLRLKNELRLNVMARLWLVFVLSLDYDAQLTVAIHYHSRINAYFEYEISRRILSRISAPSY